MFKKAPTTVILLRAIRDLKIFDRPQRSVIEAIILRGDHKKDFKCFPANSRLVLDTGYGESTIRRVTGELAERGYLLIKPRPRLSNVYYVNWPRIMQEAETLRAVQPEESDELDGFSHEVSGPEATREEDNPDFLDDFEASQPDPTPAAKGDDPEGDIDPFYRLIGDWWSFHPTFMDRNRLKAQLRRCARMAGGVNAAMEIVKLAAEEPTIVNALHNCDHLGSYLITCFEKGWVTKYKKGGK